MSETQPSDDPEPDETLAQELPHRVLRKAMMELSTRHIFFHVFVYPNYYGTALAITYAQIESRIDLSSDVSLNARLWHLSYLDQQSLYSIRDHQDWRLAMAKQLRKSSVCIAISEWVAKDDNRDSAMVIGVSRSS